MPDFLHVGSPAGDRRKNFTLPPEIVTETTAILGIRNSGKTNTATVCVEELLELGFHVVVIDPTDVWWGLKSKGEGEEEGYPVVILGGTHGDLPLEDGDGKTLADFAVERQVPMVLSLRHLRKAAQRRFVTAFAEQIYHRKGAAEHRRPLLVVIDEASTFIPQRVGKGEARMLGAIEDLVRRGRASGFGVMVIDQRPASVNKDVLTQLEVLVAHQVTSPQDRKALDEWVKQHDARGYRETFLEELASLEQGEAFFWSPGLDLFEQVAVRKRRTFDSSRTPELGEEIQPPEKVAEIDLDTLKEQLGETIERARKEDPKLLKERIRELEKDLKAAKTESPPPDPELIEREVQKAVHAREKELLPVIDSLRERIERANPLAERLLQELHLNGDGDAPEPSPSPERPRASPRPAPEPRTGAPAAEGDLPRGQQKILDALASLEAVGVTDVTRENAAVFSGQSPKSSAYTAHLAALRDTGLITYPRGGHVAITADGLREARAPDPPRSVDELHQAWKRYLPNAQIRILEALIDAYPGSIDKETLAELADQSPRSSAYTAHLATLRSLGVADYPEPGHVVATELLFPPALI